MCIRDRANIYPTNPQAKESIQCVNKNRAAALWSFKRNLHRWNTKNKSQNKTKHTCLHQLNKNPVRQARTSHSIFQRFTRWGIFIRGERCRRRRQGANVIRVEEQQPDIQRQNKLPKKNRIRRRKGTALRKNNAKIRFPPNLAPKSASKRNLKWTKNWQANFAVSSSRKNNKNSSK